MILLIRSKSTTSLESYLVTGIENFLQKRKTSLIDVFVDDIIQLNNYLVTGIEDFLQKKKTSLIDVFVDDIIQLNNTSSIGSELDAVFITAMIQKREHNVLGQSALRQR